MQRQFHTEVTPQTSLATGKAWGAAGVWEPEAECQVTAAASLQLEFFLRKRTGSPCQGPPLSFLNKQTLGRTSFRQILILWANIFILLSTSGTLKPTGQPDLYTYTRASIFINVFTTINPDGYSPPKTQHYLRHQVKEPDGFALRTAPCAKTQSRLAGVRMKPAKCSGPFPLSPAHAATLSSLQSSLAAQCHLSVRRLSI